VDSGWKSDKFSSAFSVGVDRCIQLTNTRKTISDVDVDQRVKKRLPFSVSHGKFYGTRTRFPIHNRNIVRLLSLRGLLFLHSRKQACCHYQQQ